MISSGVIFLGHHDDQKQHEQECLSCVLQADTCRCFGDLRMLEYFRCDDVGFTGVHPDFMKAGIVRGQRVFIGIEHFDVDMMSRVCFDKKSLEPVAQSVTLELDKRDMDHAYAWCQERDSFGEIIPGVLNADKIFEWAVKTDVIKLQHLEVGSHRSLLLSYKSGIAKHIGKKKSYKSEMRNYMKLLNYDSAKLKPFWLINVYVRPYRMMVVNAQHVQNVVYPVTTDVLALLKACVAKDLSGIVLCVHDMMYGDGANVFCLSTEMLQHDLIGTYVPVCVYVGADAELIDGCPVDDWLSFVDKMRLSNMLELDHAKTVNVPMMKDICDTFSGRGRYAFYGLYSYLAMNQKYPYRCVYPLMVRIDLYNFASRVFNSIRDLKNRYAVKCDWCEDDEYYFVDKIFCHKGLLVCTELEQQGIRLPSVRRYLEQVLSDFNAYKASIGNAWPFPDFFIDTHDRVMLVWPEGT